MQKPLIAITGASSGIGKSIAQLFSMNDYPLLLLGRRIDRMEAEAFPNALCKNVDVTDLEQFTSAIEEAEKMYGPVDCLVNNAGVMLLGQVDTQPAEEWSRMYNTNVVGLLNGMQTVLSSMKKRNEGTIVNISSIAGKKSFPNHAAYCGTKFAVHAISETVREEVADHNVRVVTIAPGVVETELVGHTSSREIVADYEDWKKSIGGAMRPEDIARSVLFAYEQPQNVCIREIALAPTRQQP